MDFTAQPRTQAVPNRSALIVDEDPQVTSALGSVFESEAWAIVHAPDNREALKLAEARAFDLIVTGTKSSGKEDIDLWRKIRRVRPHVRLIILTDASTPNDVITAMRERAFSYFTKPFSTASLAEIVRSATTEPFWDDGIELVSATPEWISIIARCDKKTADRLVQFFQEVSDLPAPERDDVAVGFREMLLNAIEHGGNFDPNQYVEVAYVRTRKSVMCRIKDPGEGFSLEEIHHAAVNNPSYDPIRLAVFREAQGLRPGGYGVLLAKHIVDELMYSEKGNEVLLIKYLSPSVQDQRSPENLPNPTA
jgi:anti-sigma regulatory factor (Ser/Thr protein kinase)/ActR/RegA family two-component response regulator